jgi:hypothetical protein
MQACSGRLLCSCCLSTKRRQISPRLSQWTIPVPCKRYRRLLVAVVPFLLSPLLLLLLPPCSLLSWCPASPALACFATDQREHEQGCIGQAPRCHMIQGRLCGTFATSFAMQEFDTVCLLAKSLLQRLLGQSTAISAKRIDEGGVEGEPCGGGCRAVYAAGRCGDAVWLLACLPVCLQSGLLTVGRTPSDASPLARLLCQAMAPSCCADGACGRFAAVNLLVLACPLLQCCSRKIAAS